MQKPPSRGERGSPASSQLPKAGYAQRTDGEPGGSLLGQCLLQIADQILDRFDADGKSQQIRWCSAIGALDAGAVLDQALDATERGGASPKPDPGAGFERRLASALEADRKHATVAAVHLTARDSMAGICGQSGIEHGGEPR